MRVEITNTQNPHFECYIVRYAGDIKGAIAREQTVPYRWLLKTSDKSGYIATSQSRYALMEAIRAGEYDEELGVA